MVTSQGEEAQKLSEERRSRWISAISRDDPTEEILENDNVCEKHFVSGRAGAGINLILTGFRHCSWDTKRVLIERIKKKRRLIEARERTSTGEETGFRKETKRA